MTQTITAWLARNGLGHYESVFALNGIDVDVLLDLSEDDLAGLGVTLGDRKRLARALGAQRTAAEAPAAGAAADPWSQRPGERKAAAILFADLTGSTALTEHLDPEDAHQLLYGALEQMCAAIEHHRGTVCRLMGDGLMALFGAPVAFEEYAENACRAALEILGRVEAYGREIEARTGPALRVRVGLHAGEVVVLRVGDAGHASYDASGPAVALAARMEQNAAPGTVQLSAATYALVSHRFEGDPLPALQAKGFPDPIAAVRLGAERPASEADPDEPFVGRRSELGQLDAALDACIDDRAGRVVYLRGEPGIGKTRLLEKLTDAASARGFGVHRTLVLPFGNGKGRDPVRLLVRDLLGVEANASEAERREAVAAALLAGRVEAADAPYLCDLVDIPPAADQRAQYAATDARHRANERARVLGRLLASLGLEKPRLVVVEDLHFAPAAILAYVVQIAETTASSPMILAITSRVEDDKLATAWRSALDGLPLSLLNIAPLLESEARALADHAGVALPETVEACIGRSGRNPLFLSHLLRSAASGDSTELPTSIQTSVAARVDGLDAADKQAVRAAAVLGPRFESDMLRALIGDADYACGRLVERGLVKQDGDGFLFSHALVHESVLAGLLRSERRGLHARAAQWFEDRDPVLYASHLDRADSPLASAAYLDAAREEMDSLRYQFARDFVERGLAVAGDAAPLADLHALHGRLLLAIGEMRAAAAAYRRAARHAEDPPEQCAAWTGAAHAYRNSGAYDEGLAALDEAERIASSQGLDRALAEIHHHRGNILFLLVDADGCEREQHESMAFARRSGDAEAEALALSGLARVGFVRGHCLSGAGYARRCVELTREHGLDYLTYGHLHMIGIGLHYELRLPDALEWMTEAAEKAPGAGAPRQAVVSNFFCAQTLHELGRDGEARRYAERSRDFAHQVGELRYLPGTESILAKLDAAAGERSETGQQLLARWHALDPVDRAFSGAFVLGALALTARNADLHRWAIAEGRKLKEAPCVRQFLLSFYLDGIHACLQRGDRRTAAELGAELAELTRAEPMPLTDLYVRLTRAAAAETASGNGALGELAAEYANVVAAGLADIEPTVRALLR